jgi:DNA-binding CsgD family transcriptional regulator
MGNAVLAAHAAYALDGDDSDWLARLVEVMGPLLDAGRGLVGFRWGLAPDGSVQAHEMRVAGGRAGDEEMLRELLGNLDSTRSSLAYEAPYSFKSLSEIARDHPTLTDLKRDRDMQRIAHDREVVDFEMLRIDEARDRGWMFSVLHPEVRAIPSPRRALWQRVGAHIAAGARLRLQLAAPRLDEAAAVYDPATGRLEVTERELTSAGRRRRLVEIIEARRAADRLADQRPLEAMELWKGLVAGRWSLLDVLDSDGRVFTILRENPLGVRSRVALSERERQAAFLVGRGHHVKLVAYELGLSPATVRAQLRTAMRKLNVEDRAGLCRLVASVSRARSATAVDELDLLALTDAPPRMPEPLSRAEREVATLAYEGLSNAEIATRRGTSERTVANQLASVYRKLHVSSRDELVRELARAGEGPPRG